MLNLDKKKFISFILIGERQAVLAPPETEWYHGRLDRYTSEERLWAAGKHGSYLGKIYHNYKSNYKIKKNLHLKYNINLIKF